MHGDVEAEVVAGGVDGNWCARARGTPGAAWIERRVVYSQPERPWGRQRIAGAARVKLPTGVDIEDYGLVTVAVVNGGVVAWPDPRRGDPEAAVELDVAAAVVATSLRQLLKLSSMKVAFPLLRMTVLPNIVALNALIRQMRHQPLPVSVRF